ncbi:MAG: hypothetical protein JW737_05060 [Acidobacteria bacterium]|nr:hypothetical protein [Acidobacteriota bacterium]
MRNMKRCIVLSTVILILLSSSLFAASWIKVMAPRKNDTTGKTGETFTFRFGSEIVRNAKSFLIVGGIEGESKLYYNKVLPTWPGSVDNYPQFDWTPQNAGTYTVYFESDPNNAQGLKEKVTLVVTITGGTTAPGKSIGMQMANADMSLDDVIVKPDVIAKGSKVTVEFKILNVGNVQINPPIEVKLEENGTERCSVSSQNFLPVGGVGGSLKCSFIADHVGDYYLIAKLNPDKKVFENNYLNNEKKVQFKVYENAAINISPNQVTSFQGNSLQGDMLADHKVEVYDWNFLDNQGKPITTFSLNDTKTVLKFRLINRGKDKYNGMITSVEFFMDDAPDLKSFEIKAQKPVTNLSKRPAEFIVPNILVKDILSRNADNHFGQRIKIKIHITPGFPVSSQAQKYNWQLPDLTIIPKSFEVKCSPQRYIKITYEVESKHYSIPSGEKVEVEYYYVDWPELGSKNDIYLKREFNGPFSKLTFETPKITKTMYHAPVPHTLFCQAVDPRNKIKELNEDNNVNCVYGNYSLSREEKCLERTGNFDPKDIWSYDGLKDKFGK